MNNIYIYNNFYDLLNLINKLINNNIKPDNIKNINFSPTLFDNLIKLDLKNDESIINNTIKKIGYTNFNIIYKVFLSEYDNKELIIYYYYKNSLKYKEQTIYMRNIKCVNLSLKIAKYVGSETHKLKGFLRFIELKNNVLYATIEPTNNVLELLSIHFKKRLKNEYWIIEDKKRNIISLYDKNDYTIINSNDFKISTNELSKNELNIENLWINFYKTIGIKSRKNERCRMNFMPKKYWKYIIEMSDEYEKNS